MWSKTVLGRKILGLDSNSICRDKEKHEHEDGTMMLLNDVRHYAYFKVLKWSGLFPYDLKVQEVNGNEKTELKMAVGAWSPNSGIKGAQIRVGFTSAAWPWRVLHNAVLVLYIFFNAFIYAQLLRRLIASGDSIFAEFENRNASSLPLLPLVYRLTILAWALNLNSSMVIFFIFWWRKDAIVNLIVRWYEVGGRIRSAAFSRGRDRAHCRPTISWAVGTLILVFWSAFLFGIGANQYMFPRHAVYIYSLVPRSIEIPWMRVVSFVANQLTCLCTVVHSTGFVILATVLSEAVMNFLRFIEPEPETPTAEKLSLGQAIATYDELRSLVDEFNKLFSSHLVYLKCNLLLSICILVYTPLYFSATVPFIGIVVFFSGALSLSFYVYLILTRMGAVYAESKEFKAAWGKASLAPEYLRTRSPIERYENKYARARLQFLAPIQFWFGAFYTARPSTILTFFSVVTTYLIFLLQIRAASN